MKILIFAVLLLTGCSLNYDQHPIKFPKYKCHQEENELAELCVGIKESICNSKIDKCVDCSKPMEGGDFICEPLEDK